MRCRFALRVLCNFDYPPPARFLVKLLSAQQHARTALIAMFLACPVGRAVHAACRRHADVGRTSGSLL